MQYETLNDAGSSDQEAVSDDRAPLIDPLAMRQWTEDLDPSDVKDVLSRVPEETSHCMRLLRDAIEQSDVVMARRAAHRMKGMASNLGAARLAQAARSIELGGDSIRDVRGQMHAFEVTLMETLAALDAQR